jgi:hypothetical protein
MTGNIADLSEHNSYSDRWHCYYTNKLELRCQQIKSGKELLFFVGKSGLFCKKCQPKCGNPTKIVNLSKSVINEWMVKGRTKWSRVEAKEYQLGGRKSKQTFQYFFPKTINGVSHSVLHSQRSSQTNM